MNRADAEASRAAPLARPSSDRLPWPVAARWIALAVLAFWGAVAVLVSLVMG